MKVCDRCLEPAVDTIIFVATDEHKDVCASCLMVFKEFLHKREPSPEELTKPVEKGTTKGRKGNGRKRTGNKTKKD